MHLFTFSMDTISGSLRDSDPTSPVSPQSPQSPTPLPYSKPFNAHNLTVHSHFHTALLSSLQSSWRRAQHASDPFSPPSLTDSEALITAELRFSNSDDSINLSVQCNSLDVIGKNKL